MDNLDDGTAPFSIEDSQTYLFTFEKREVSNSIARSIIKQEASNKQL